MRVYRRMLLLPWTEHVNINKVLRKVVTKSTFILRKRHLQFLGNIKRKGDLENMTLTGYTEGKRGRVR